MPVGKRRWLRIGGIALTSASLFVGGSQLMVGVEASRTTSSTQTQAAGHVTEAELGNMIRAMGIDCKVQDRRFDFGFEAVFNKEKWNLSMSAVLSENGNSIWVMAWLDQCPRSAADVPRTALLRLLAKNDSLGNGKFFAFIPSNNRFVLQRVVSNENLTTAKFREILQDLGASVVETYPHWSVANWKQPDQGNLPPNKAKSAPAQPSDPQRVSNRPYSQRAGYNPQN